MEYSRSDLAARSDLEYHYMNYKEFFREKKVTVFGLGLHGGGVGTVRFLARAGAKVTVTDIKTKEQLHPSLEKLSDVKNIHFVLGQHRSEDFTRADLVVISPAILWNNQYVRAALEKKIPVEMDAGLFFRFCPCPIIGVTGTKGKTTVSLLIHEILKKAGKDSILVGVGQTPVLDRLEKVSKNSVVVFELSSWRLGALGRNKVSPHIAVFSNFLPDHLNYYSSVEKYLSDKKNIFRFQKPNDWCLLNRNDGAVTVLSSEVPSQIGWFGFSRNAKGHGVFIKDGALYLNDGVDEKKIIATNEVPLRGKHNLANTAAASAAASAFGIGITAMGEGIRSFRGAAHRMELVGEAHGVAYYNDTAATIPEATQAALSSFTQPVILIAGGSDKNLSYENFAVDAARYAKEIIFLSGAASEKMKAALAKVLGGAREFYTASSMEEAIGEAARRGGKGDIVLFSPAAASFGMFANEFDRGEKFRAAVKKL